MFPLAPSFSLSLTHNPTIYIHTRTIEEKNQLAKMKQKSLFKFYTTIFTVFRCFHLEGKCVCIHIKYDEEREKRECYNEILNQQRQKQRTRWISTKERKELCFNCYSLVVRFIRRHFKHNPQLLAQRNLWKVLAEKSFRLRMCFAKNFINYSSQGRDARREGTWKHVCRCVIEYSFDLMKFKHFKTVRYTWKYISFLLMKQQVLFNIHELLYVNKKIT